MRIHRPGETGRKWVFVTPGNEFPNSDFCDESGKARQFDVEFNNGTAEVPDGLGRYMVDKGLASTSPILLLSAA